MIVSQFNNSFAVDDKWINTFMYYDNQSRLHRLGDDYFEKRIESHQDLLKNKEQENKTSFRLHFIME